MKYNKSNEKTLINKNNKKVTFYLLIISLKKKSQKFSKIIMILKIIKGYDMIFLNISIFTYNEKVNKMKKCVYKIMCRENDCKINDMREIQTYLKERK